MITQIILTNLVAYLLFQAWEFGVALKDNFKYQRLYKRRWFRELDRLWSWLTFGSLGVTAIQMIWI